MNRPSALTRGTLGTSFRPGWLGTAAAIGRSLSFRAVAIAALAITLAITPFESLVVRIDAGGLVVTDLELVWSAALVAWLAVLVRERRLPDVPRAVVLALALLAAVSFGSALLAGPAGESAVRFAFRSAALWAFFLAAADLVRSPRSASRVVVLILLGAAVAAAVGWAGHLRGTSVGLLGLGRDFTVAGQLRVTGTFDYPNTAAMAWEATLLAASPLILTRRWWTRAVVIGALVLIGGAMLLTHSRGALLGTLAGCGALAMLALMARHRRPALLAAAAGVAVVAGMAVVQVGAAVPVARLTAESDRELYSATYSAPASLEVSPGAEVHIPVALTNSGAASWHAAGAAPFRLSYHWLDPESRAVNLVDGARTALPRTVEPGERVELSALVVAPPDAGRHVLAWDVVHEGVAWLSERGVPAWATTIDVRGPPAGTTPTPVADPTPVVAGAVDVWPDLVPVPSRAELWAAAVEMVRQHPVLGVGPGNYRLLYGAFLGWERWDERIHANDLYLELAATIGLVGLACFLVLVGVVLVRAVKGLALARWGHAGPGSHPDLPSGRWLMAAGLVAALVAFLAHGVVDYFLAFAPTGLLFWAFLGMALGLSRHAQSSVP